MQVLKLLCNLRLHHWVTDPLDYALDPKTNADGALWFKENFQMIAYDLGLGDTRVDKSVNGSFTNYDYSYFLFGDINECIDGLQCRGMVKYFDNYSRDIVDYNVIDDVEQITYLKNTGAGGMFSDRLGGNFGVESENITSGLSYRASDLGSLLVRLEPGTYVPSEPVIDVGIEPEPPVRPVEPSDPVIREVSAPATMSVFSIALLALMGMRRSRH